MQLQLVRHLWGVSESFETAFPKFVADGFSALEAPICLMDEPTRDRFECERARHGLGLIVQDFTCLWERNRTVDEHLASMRVRITEALKFRPLLINLHSGSDAWRLPDMIRFYREAQRIAADCPVPVAHETHRGRAFFSPWTTRDVLEAVPGLELTVDFSHWVCVAERCLDDQLDIITLAAAHARHIHARVGYAEGPQVPDPRAPEYANDVAAHERWWDLCWDAMQRRGLASASLTPEFGPPGYMHTLPFTNQPVADLWDICTWQAHRQRDRFLARGGISGAGGSSCPGRPS
jgi:sugar phosphate isomerase/epimerase